MRSWWPCPNRARHRPRPRRDSSTRPGANSDLGGGLAARQRTAPDRPVAPLGAAVADLGGREALDVAVVPLREVGIDLGVRETGEARGFAARVSPGSRARARTRARRAPARAPRAAASPLGGERHVGAARVAARRRSTRSRRAGRARRQVSRAHPRVKRSRRWSWTRSRTSSTKIRTRPTAGCATTRPATATTTVGFYALSRYADVLEASQQPLLYSSAEGTTIEMLDTHGAAAHDDLHGPARARRAPQAREPRVHAARDQRPRAVRARRPRSTCLDPLVEAGGGDFVEEFSAILPMNVIMELLGVPAADRNQLRHWMDATLDRLEEPPYIPDHAIEAMGKTGEYWAVAARRQARASRRRLRLEAVRGGDGRRRRRRWRASPTAR